VSGYARDPEHLELVSCTNPECDLRYVRGATGSMTLPCGACGSPMEMAPGRLVLDEEWQFDAGDVRETLTAAVDECERLLSYELPGWSEGKRREMQGRRDAYREALEMVGLASVSRPLRTEVEA
jgi:hypothetical protein